MTQASKSRAAPSRLIAAAFLLPALAGIAAQTTDEPAKQPPATSPASSSGAPSDRKLLSDVKTALRQAQGLESEAITVEMDQGMVALSGEVPNVLAHDRAIRVATSVEGVRAIDDNLTVAPAQRGDHEIERDVEAALAQDPATEFWEINAIVTDGRVTLQGIVESFAEQSLAENVVKGVRGVREVNNEIQVDYGVPRDDKEITHDVVQILRWSTQVDSDTIEVEVENGIVELSGTVESLYAKNEAERLARVAGARRVDVQDLEVRAGDDGVESRWADPSDEEVAAGVRMALELDPRVGPSDVRVSVEDGTATLSGRVGSERARRAATEMARRTYGVENVRNHLAAMPEPEVPDEQLAKRVAAAIERDPYVSEDEIDVEAVEGRVFLYGEVDSYFEKYEAGDAASRIAGVRQVHNELEVPVLARNPGD